MDVYGEKPLHNIFSIYIITPVVMLALTCKSILQTDKNQQQKNGTMVQLV